MTFNLAKEQIIKNEKPQVEVSMSYEYSGGIGSIFLIYKTDRK
jgi:hypothetical protein